MLSSLIHQVVSGWPDYLAGKRVDKNSAMHKLVVEEVPNVFHSWTPNPNDFTFVGSDGRGNITTAPWCGVFHNQVTDTAQDGYYVAYGFSQDLERLVLLVMFGYMRFERLFGRNKKMFQTLEVTVKKMRQSCQHLYEQNVSESLRGRIDTGPIRLANRRDASLHTSYEKCAIYSITYQIDELPSDEILKQDYLEFHRLYCSMAESLLLPDVGDYAFENFDLESKEGEFIPTIEFEPLPKPKKESKKPDSKGSQKRYSKRADKVGRIGEERVYDQEVAALKKAGQEDLASKVIWHRNYKKNRTPGWDITSYTTDGKKKFIEVKTSEGKISSITLTPNEWKQANKKQIADHYYIYILENLKKNPSIKKLRNPAKYINDGELSIKPSEFELSLRSQE